MDINQLSSFVSVVKNQSFTKAANELFISQPTVSSHIKNLEQELNKQLIIRSTKNITITEYGWELYETAKQILNIGNSLLSKWNDDDRVEKIGASTIPAAYILPEVLSNYAIKYSPLCFSLFQGDSSEIIENLKRGDYDIAITGMKSTDEKLIIKEFYNDEIVLITPNSKKYRKYEKNKIPVKTLIENEPLIFREERSGSQKKIEEILRNMGVNINDLNIIARMNEPECIKNFVVRGFAVAMISKIAIKSLIERNEVISFELPKEYSSRKLYLIQNKTLILDKNIKKFIEFLLNYYDKI